VGELNPPPGFLAERQAMWDRLKAQSDAFLAAQVPEPIQVTLPDGKIVEAQSWRTTPYEVACGISKGLADNSVISKVDGEVWDLDRPLEKSCALQLLKFDDEDAQVRFSAMQKISYSTSLFPLSFFGFSV
jgi:threonyl-tRNA synthetase